MKFPNLFGKSIGPCSIKLFGRKNDSEIRKPIYLLYTHSCKN